MMMIFLFVELSGEYARNTSAAHNLHFFKNSLSDCDSTRESVAERRVQETQRRDVNLRLINMWGDGTAYD